MALFQFFLFWMEMAYRFWVAEKCFINFVHCCEIGHVREKNVHFDCIMQRRSTSFEHCVKILENPPL